MKDDDDFNVEVEGEDEEIGEIRPRWLVLLAVVWIFVLLAHCNGWGCDRTRVDPSKHPHH